jgi:tripeptide aminopeptidase
MTAHDEIVDLFCALVEIDSESGSERPFLEYLAGCFRDRLHADCSIGPDGNLIARLGPKGCQIDEPILLGAHADTVKPGIGIRPVIKDGVIASDGTTVLGADNKAAIAEIMLAIERAPRHPPLEVVVTHGEEIGLLGAKALDTSGLRSTVGFVFDTSDLRSIVLGGPSYAALDIEVLGRSAHAGLRPSEGISAIAVAASAISQLQLGQLDERTTANVGMIHGGSARNVVPDRVEINAECRSFDHRRCLAISRDIESAFRAAAQAAGATAKVAIRVDHEASVLSAQSPAVMLARSALQKVGLKPDVKTLLGGTDAIILQKKGIDAVVMGYGGREAHTTREHILIRDMLEACRIIQALLESASERGNLDA